MADARVLFYLETGELQATVETPECNYDTYARLLTSTNHVHAVRLDLNDSIDGDGFCYQQTNSFMVISNNVWTRVNNVAKQK